MLASGENRRDIALCRELGISVYVIKPVARADLHAAIVSALGISAQPEPASAKAPERRAPTERTGVRILLTEDNLVNQRLATRILQWRAMR